MNILVKDKLFYKTFFSMTILVAMQNLITFSVGLADNIMIGGYDQMALSGVAIVNQIQFLLQMLMNGICSGIMVLGAQYWGKKQTEPIRKVTSIGVNLAIATGLLMMVLVTVFPSQILHMLCNDEVVIEQGMKYLRIVSFSYIFFSIGSVLLGALRAVETVKIGFFVNLTALFVNIFLNYGLIYGKLGMPELGTEGAALATLTSRIVEFLIITVYVLFFDKKIRWKPSGLMHMDSILLQDYIRIGLPCVLSSGLWGIATSVQTAILGRLGADTIAANSIAVTLFQVVSVVLYASANSTGVMIGKTVGTGELSTLRTQVRTFQILFLCIGLFTGLWMYSLKDLIIGLYSITPETAALTAQFILILSVSVIFSAYQMPVLNGIVTGGGDTRFVLINDFVSQWIVVLPLSFASAFLFHWPLWVTFLCLKSDQFFKCIVAVVKVNRYRWVRVLTR